MHLGLSQSAVSWKIKRLEDKVGRPLLVRTGHSLRPTRDGALVMEEARRIVEAHDELVDRLSRSDLTGRVRLGATEEVSSVCVSAVLAGFNRRHPEAWVEFFVDRLSQGIAVLAAAFWPRQVILRFSDFKTNEYARLIGGAAFEPTEANPMLGWRGASRYYHPEFRDGFLLECAAVRRVRETMGLTNLDVMIPFCRTVAEGARVLEVAAGAGLGRTPAGPRWYVMAEIPSNILCADRFAELFDGFSIGSNDLTQLMLGVDRDSPRVAPLFDERDEAVKRAFVMLIERAHAAGRTVGICGQAPSDYPELAAFLVQHGIDSLSLTPDAVVPTWRRVAAVEARGR